jgi:bifunctional non-homologous end joining protein LigD
LLRLDHVQPAFNIQPSRNKNLNSLTSLYQKFQKLARRDCPFANLPEKLGAAGRGLTASQMKLCTWLEPKLVCQIRFAEWTHDRHLRQPAFLGLREDKDPREVVREMLAS